MNFSHLSNGSLIAYINYFKQMLSIKDNSGLSDFLKECVKEYENRKLINKNGNI